MVCIGLLGCKHIHRSASSYFLLALAIAGTLLGLRILLYVLARCLQKCQQSLMPDREEIEMAARAVPAAMQQYYQHQWRRSAAAGSSQPRGEWQSKLVIAAGCDHVSYIAQPCPLQTNGGVSV